MASAGRTQGEVEDFELGMISGLGWLREVVHVPRNDI